MKEKISKQQYQKNSDANDLAKSLHKIKLQNKALTKILNDVNEDKKNKSDKSGI